MRKGFTLIELLIVLAVIAALMSVATPLALNAVKNAKASQVAQN
ncbi:MAG: type II secretion system protein, partial [Fervidobacterium pennivorans]